MTEKKSRFSTNQLNIDLFASLIFAFTILTIACMGLLYVQIIDLGYLHLFSVIILTEVFVLIRRIRIKLVPMFLLHVGAMALYLWGMSFLLTWQGKKDIQAGLIFLGVMATANLVYSMLRRFQKSSVSVTHDVFIASLALHLVLYIIASIVDMGTKTEGWSSAGNTFVTLVHSLSDTGSTRHFILLNAILIVCVYLVARQLYTFDTKYHHNTHSSTQPVKQVTRQNHLTIVFIFGGILLTLLVLNTIPVSTILSGLRSLVVMIGRFFAQFLPNDKGSIGGPTDTPTQEDDMQLPDPGDGGEPLFVQILIVMFVVFVIIMFLVAVYKAFRRFLKLFHIEESVEKVKGADDAVVDIIEEVPQDKKSRFAKKDFGTGYEREIRKKYYKTVQKAIHAGTKVDPSYTPKQIESALKRQGDPSISELTSLYESVRYSEKKD